MWACALAISASFSALLADFAAVLAGVGGVWAGLFTEGLGEGFGLGVGSGFAGDGEWVRVGDLLVGVRGWLWVGLS
jgi:hypothetical protein